MLDALQQSGMNVDDLGRDSSSSESENPSSESSGAASDGGEGSGGDSRSRGDMPFGDIPFVGGFGRRRARRDSSGGGSGDEPPNVEFSSSLGDRMAEWSKRTLMIAVIVAIIILLAAYWWFHPPISINSMDTWMFVTIFILAPCFLFFSGKSRRYKKGGGKIFHTDASLSFPSFKWQLERFHNYSFFIIHFSFAPGGVRGGEHCSPLRVGNP